MRTYKCDQRREKVHEGQQSGRVHNRDRASRPAVSCGPGRDIWVAPGISEATDPRETRPQSGEKRRDTIVHRIR